MRLEWSLFALADRDEIFDYIETDNPGAAVALDERVRDQVQLVIECPESGRIGRVPGTRELIINGTPYLVAYRIRDDTVRIVRVIHGSRQWPDAMPD